MMEPAGDRSAFDVNAVRDAFPILAREVYGRPLVYLDSAASAQKPQSVIDAETRVYAGEYANVHRGAHFLSGAATDAFEASRSAAREFINAAADEEIIFTRGATEAINLVAASYGESTLRPNDRILLTEAEHHANIVPWQLIAERKGAMIDVVRLRDDETIAADDVIAALTDRTKIVAIAGMSNTLGQRYALERIIPAAHDAGAVVLIDACQLAVHEPIDVQALDCDFLTFSGHKIYGPSGVGVLYGKRALLEAMPPYQSGGEMIASVSFEQSTWADLPHKFEAGTPAIAQVIALKEAIGFVREIGWASIQAHEAALRDATRERLAQINSLRIYGDAPNKGAIFTFTMNGAHAHDVATLVDRQGVALRSGHHCAQPLMARLGVTATVRASFAVYNTLEDVEVLGAALEKAQRMLV